MNLNDLFDDVSGADGDAAPREKTPWMKFKPKDGERVRLRVLEDFDELQAQADISHWVDGVGRVKCNLHPIKDQKNPGKIFLWNGYGAGVNKKPEYNCKFCEETKALKDDAIARFGKDTPQGKTEAIKAGRLHNRSQQFNVNVEYEIWKTPPGKKKPECVQELTQALTSFRINDLFSTNGKGVYSLLKNMFDNKGTLKNNWFTMGIDYNLTPDDPLPDEVKSREVALFDKPKVWSYKDGLEKYLVRQGHGSAAEPLEGPEDDDDDEIPF